MDETERIQAIIDGDTDGYRYFVERYHAGLIIHCDQILRDRDEAEDIAQEAFCQAYQKLAEFDPKKARYSTWLYRIATNRAIDSLRRRKHYSDGVEIDSIADAAPLPDINDDDRARLRSAVEQLTPPEYRSVIEAYYWHGKSYEMIANELNIPRNTVGTWMSRAKVQLREALV